MMMNIGKVKIRGIDFTARLAFRLPHDIVLEGGLNYTYQKAQDYSNPADTLDGGTYKGQIAYIPWHSGSAVLGLEWTSRRGDHYGLNYSFIYVGERYGQQENTIYNYVQPWYTHDLSLYGEWGITVHRTPYAIHPLWLKANIELNNLLGQDYEVIQNYPMPKQNVRCTIALRY
jgi:outer membrane receptor protein involved in Fe transport